jgi:hypothetical protein
MSGKVVGLSVVAGVVMAVSAGVGAGGAVGGGGGAAATSAAEPTARAVQRRPIRFEVSDLFIEINATDGDAGLQLNLDGEGWTRVTLRDPKGRRVMEVRGTGRLRGYGLTGITFESAEPPFREVPLRRFKARFPAGRYTFAGTTADGRRLVGSDRLTHRIPAKPAVTSPVANAVVDPAGLVARWEPVTTPKGVKIVRYLVIVTAEASERELSMELGPNATSAVIPADFLERGARYAIEVLAREASGNQTITEVPFRTSA